MLKQKIIKSLLAILLISMTLKADDASTFDIMYVYTTAAKNRAGGTEQILAQINQSVIRINNSFINSYMNVRVNLVHASEIYYPLDIWEWKGDDIMRARFYAASSHVRGKYDGYMDDIHTLRDRYSADLVQVIISNAAFGGLAPVMTNNSHTFEAQAFTVIGEKFLLGSSVHELGHLMGNEHDIYTAGNQDGTYSYSHGYGSPSNNFRTIMSYSKACTGVNNDACANSGINYWSSPNQYYNGEVLGASYADARQTILNNAEVIANFRQRPTTTSPTLTTTPPLETYQDSMIIEVNGEAGYAVYINGVKKGTLNASGKVLLSINLINGNNEISVTLKHELSGVVSDALRFTIFREDNLANIIVATIIVPYILSGN